MIRFGEISSLWPKVNNLLRVYLAFGSILNLLWQIFIVVNGKILKNNLVTLLVQKINLISGTTVVKYDYKLFVKGWPLYLTLSDISKTRKI